MSKSVPTKSSAPCKKLKRISIANAVVALSGLLLSCYALYVEVKKHEDNNYTAMCDISENISCSKAFMSPYGTGFGILDKIFGANSILNVPNPIYGIIHYSVYLCIGFWKSSSAAKIQLGFGIAGIFMSMYLAYILYILHNVCVVCVATYAVNVLLFVLTSWKVLVLKQMKKKIL